MKFRNLNLLAFGPFTNKSLDFSDGNFHIIYGPNEAGKSSALRAIADFLYGFPGQTRDNFIHHYNDLRIGATLEDNAGNRATFLRRKGRIKTLLNENEEPVPESEIETFLGNINRDLFKQMFGLDHQRLIQGGEEIVSGESDVGENIFSAGMGIIGLHRLLSDLEKTADDLFKPSGQNPPINRLISEFTTTQKAISEASLPPRAYKEKSNALAEVEAQRERLRTKSAELLNRFALLERLQNAAPIAAQLAQAQSKRAELRAVVLLSDDFPERRAKIFGERRETETKIDQFQADIKHLQAKIEENRFDQRLLELKTEISDLFERRAIFIKNEEELPILENEFRSLHEDAEILLGRLGLSKKIDEAEKLRLTSPQKARITAAADQLKNLHREILASQKQKRDLQAKITTTKAELETLPLSRETDSLQRATRNASSLHHQIDDQKKLEKEIQDLDSEATRIFQQLLPAAGSKLEEIEILPLPSQETIRRFETELNSCGNHLNQLKKEIAETESALEKLSLEILSVTKGETVPSEEELAENRARRDHGWQLVRLSWQGPQPEDSEIAEFTNGKPLADTYEKSIAKADEISDQLRRESSRVAQLHELDKRENLLQQKLKKLQEDKEAAREAFSRRNSEWRTIWEPAKIAPLSPAEMNSWLNKVQDLLKILRELEQKRSRLKEIDSTIEESRKRLIDECEKIGSQSDRELSSTELLDQAEIILEKIDRENQRRNQTEKILADLASDLEQSKGDLDDFTNRETVAREEWGKTVEPLGLSSSSTPEEAQKILDDIGAVFQKIDEAKTRQNRIEQIKSERDIFEKKIAALLEKLGESAQKSPPQEIIAGLNQRLGESENNAKLTDSFQKDIAAKELALTSAKAALTGLSAQIEDLLTEAKTEDEADLPELERISNEARKLDQSIEALQKQLFGFCRNEKLEELIAAIDNTDFDALPGEIQRLKAEQEETQSELNDLTERVGRFKTQLEQLDGSPAAALKAQESEEIKAELFVKIEEFARARLASTLLRREIDRYREKNQGPILQRTGEIFSRLTLGSFSGLATDFTSQDKQILVGLRSDGTKIQVEGMSDGTCDQLYLALRLASLEHHIEKNQPMPLILDDILVNFDDERARATLEILSEISEKNQIIYFTHHRHILDIAKPLQTTIHDLSSPEKAGASSFDESLATIT